MALYCFKCRNEVDLIVKVGITIGRLDTCQHCGANLHACKNCHFYDATLHNECRETTADFIRDREGANFCAHFQPLDRDAPPPEDNQVAKARGKLDDLFKNLK